MKKRWPSKGAIGYVAVIGLCFAAAMCAGWLSIGDQIDNDSYDWMFRRHPPTASSTHSVVLAIDDPTLNTMGGTRALRTILATTLQKLAAVQPKVVAIDLILADLGDPKEDALLESAFTKTRNLVLATDLVNGVWENPLPRFRRWAAAVGSTTADAESRDGVTREIMLDMAAARERHWALALESFRLQQGVKTILESPDDLQIGPVTVPARRVEARPMKVAYLPEGVPSISVKQALADPAVLARCREKAVFIGVYSTNAARDRVVTPFGDRRVPGVEVNAAAFETLSRGDFFVNASNLSVVVFCAAVAVAAGLIFAYLSGWMAYVLGAALLLAAHMVPIYLFDHRIVFPTFAPLSSAWLTVGGAAVYQHFVVRRQLRRSEDERTRYRQAIHFVTHEMRTPLTAIQGSSELIGRYNLNDEKRKQIASMINSESKRLARMIQTFLDVERLTDGQMELKSDPFDVRDLITGCVDRVRPLAARKSIEIHAAGEMTGALRGDRELMEYALYNLLTNAVKYSPANTEIHVSSSLNAAQIRLSVQDQGMGMDERELKRIFQRFYRTRRAEASGEVGSGIGLSIVDQIVKHHHGHMEVTSEPEQGSCFTMVVPAYVRDAHPAAVSS